MFSLVFEKCACADDCWYARLSTFCDLVWKIWESDEESGKKSAN